MDKDKAIEEIMKILINNGVAVCNDIYLDNEEINYIAKAIYNAGYRKQGACEWRPSKKIGNKEIGDGWFDTDCGCTLNGDIKNYDPIYCLNCSKKVKIMEGKDG